MHFIQGKIIEKNWSNNLKLLKPTKNLSLSYNFYMHDFYIEILKDQT